MYVYSLEIFRGRTMRLGLGRGLGRGLGLGRGRGRGLGLGLGRGRGLGLGLGFWQWSAGLPSAGSNRNWRAETERSASTTPGWAERRWSRPAAS